MFNKYRFSAVDSKMHVVSCFKTEFDIYSQHSFLKQTTALCILQPPQATIIIVHPLRTILGMSFPTVRMLRTNNTRFRRVETVEFWKLYCGWFQCSHANFHKWVPPEPSLFLESVFVSEWAIAALLQDTLTIIDAMEQYEYCNDDPVHAKGAPETKIYFTPLQFICAIQVLFMLG